VKHWAAWLAGEALFGVAAGVYAAAGHSASFGAILGAVAFGAALLGTGALALLGRP
jgi:hypothetical protein